MDIYHCNRKIEVHQWIIDRASVADSGHCMIADAIKEAWPEVHDVSVCLQTIRISVRETGKRYIYLTPQHCQEQLLRFDYGTHLKAWAFKIPSRPAQIVPIKRDASRPNKKNRPTTEGKKEVRTKTDISTPTIHGGHPPIPAVLAQSARGGARGRKRKFGARVAGTFDPAVDPAA